MKFDTCLALHRSQFLLTLVWNRVELCGTVWNCSGWHLVPGVLGMIIVAGAMFVSGVCYPYTPNY